MKLKIRGDYSCIINLKPDKTGCLSARARVKIKKLKKVVEIMTKSVAYTTSTSFRRQILKWFTVFLITIIILLLHIRWRITVHIVAGFAWWGMVFFLVFILLPIFPKMSRKTRYEVLGFVFPRIFRTASVVGFLTVVVGWYIALNDLANWNFSYFFENISNALFLISIVLVTSLFGFHVFLERQEIQTCTACVEKALAKTEENDEEIEILISHLQKIPKVGFVILNISLLMMFVH